MLPFRRLLLLLLTPALLATGCGANANPEARTAATADVRTVAATTAVVIERPISRFVAVTGTLRSEEHSSELQSLRHLVCRLLLEKKKKKIKINNISNSNNRRNE